MNLFEGKTVIVTGASSGLGAAAALRFAREGANVVVAARRADKGQAVVEQIEALGAQGLFVKTDVSVTADVKALVEQTVTRFGKLDCAVNNAGIAGPVGVPLAKIDEEDWETVIRTNLTAMWLCMKYEIPAMLANGGGAIVNVSSAYGYKPSDMGHAPYCTSKFGIIGLSKTAAIDYAKKNIRVNVIAPGFTQSEMVEPYIEKAEGLVKALVHRHSAMNRIGEANEVAEAILWLCSDAASFVNGVVLPVDGGETSRLY